MGVEGGRETAIWAVRGGGTRGGRTVPSVTAARRRPERLWEKLKICRSIYVFARFRCAYMCAMSLPTRGAPSPQLLCIAHVPQEPAKGASEGKTTGSGRQGGGKSCGIQTSVPRDRVCTRAGAWGQWAHRKNSISKMLHPGDHREQGGDLGSSCLSPGMSQATRHLRPRSIALACWSYCTRFQAQEAPESGRKAVQRFKRTQRQSRRLGASTRCARARRHHELPEKVRRSMFVGLIAKERMEIAPPGRHDPKF